jgi:glycosyltransferase involved in cell wall biosynthesis
MPIPNAHLRSKRILVAHNVERHGKGGMARLIENMHTALEPYGWQIDYFTADDVAAIGSHRMRRFGFPWYLRCHVRNAFLRGEPYSIVNVHEPAGAAVVVARERLGRPAIVAMSYGVEQRYWEIRLDKALGMDDAPGRKERITVPLLSLWQSRMTLRRADHIFCNNQQDRGYLESQMHVDSARITHVFSGAGPEFATAAPRRIYARPCTKLLFSGTWIVRKGIRQVVAAFAELAARNVDLQLGVLGAGVPSARVLADFPPPLHSRVTVLPPMSHDECAEVLLDYDIFLLPSFFEGTPLALIEAMCTGIPAITTNTAGMRDVVQDGMNGIFVTPGNAGQIVRAVEQLCVDADLRQRLGRRAAQDASLTYTWQALGALVHQAYSNLIGS